MPSSETAVNIFECLKCGDCCRGYGGTYLTDRDIKTIAAYVQKDLDVFKANYCRASGSRTFLTQQHNGYCIFWDRDHACTIHPVKPRMCRQWPYIESVLVDVDNWRIMASMCPGIRTDVPDHRIIEEVQMALRNDSAT
jgi:Fe-S-cluster containining protein